MGRRQEPAATFDEALQIGLHLVPASIPWLADTYPAAPINLSMLGRHEQAERCSTACCSTACWRQACRC